MASQQVVAAVGFTRRPHKKARVGLGQGSVTSHGGRAGGHGAPAAAVQLSLVGDNTGRRDRTGSQG